MSNIRERAVDTLTNVIDSLKALEGIHEGHDDVAVRDIHAALDPVIRLRDRYAAGPQQPLDPRAAQEIRALADDLEERGDRSASPIAKRDLNHEAKKLGFFLTTAGLMMTSDGLQFSVR
jgi:Mg-chelatase subunit ChlI